MKGLSIASLVVSHFQMLGLVLSKLPSSPNGLEKTLAKYCRTSSFTQT